jgi:hypothetical protein
MQNDSGVSRTALVRAVFVAPALGRPMLVKMKMIHVSSFHTALATPELAPQAHLVRLLPSNHPIVTIKSIY